MSQGHAADTEARGMGTLHRLLESDGTAAHAYATSLAGVRAPTRDLGDAVHALCSVHGHHPDLLTIAATGEADGGSRDWLAQASTAFADDRAALARLVAASGPLPSTPGQAEASAAMTAQRHALEMLARSERTGVALGAAAALIADWQTVRTVMTRAADRFGVDLVLPALPDPADLVADIPERAMSFGAQQLLAQHRGLWGLLEARSSARGQD